MALVLALASCSGAPPDAIPTSRVITPALWAGAAADDPSGSLPVIDRRNPDGRLMILGPTAIADPATGLRVEVYERLVTTDGVRRRQLLTVTQGGAALGRILEEQTGTPARRFSGDVVFPIGRWRQGEARSFDATENTLLGPAARRITLEILEIDHVHEGIARSLRYRLTIRDLAGRVLACETSVYSPGRSLVAFEAGGIWRGTCGG